MARGDQDWKRSKRANHWFSSILCGLMLLAPVGIHGDNTKKIRKYTPNVTSSTSELSSRNQSLLALYSAEIETAADKIISGSPSPNARRQALVWKAEAIPVMQTSLLNSDPIAAFLDTWAFVFQMTAFVERPEWKNTMGDFYPVVTETLRNMNVQMERLARSTGPNFRMDNTRRIVRSWAEAHPIQDSLASRQSADPDMIKKVGETNFGTLSSIKALAESMGDLSARLNSYNLYLPKQARWQSQLFLDDLKGDSQINSALSDFHALSDSAAKLDSERLSLQQFVHQERVQTLSAALMAVHGERLETLENVERQRVATLAALHAERLGTLDGVEQQRIATLAALHAERLAATADLRGERQSVVDALEKEIQTLHTDGRDLINLLFLRALELMLLTLVLCSLAWILLRRFSTKPPERAERSLYRAA